MATLNQTPTAAADVVGIFDTDGNQVFENARSMRIEVYPSKRLMSHPGESGITISDHAIIMPIEAVLYVVLQGSTYKDTYEEISALFTSNEFLAAQTKTKTYENLVLMEIPHEETPDIFDTVAMRLVFREILFATANPARLTSSEVDNPDDQSTIKRGEQSGSDATEDQNDDASLLWELLN